MSLRDGLAYFAWCAIALWVLNGPRYYSLEAVAFWAATFGFLLYLSGRFHPKE